MTWFYSLVFKTEHELYIASGSMPPPPKKKNLLGARLRHYVSPKHKQMGI
jgi:hypothetical protein